MKPNICAIWPLQEKLCQLLTSWNITHSSRPSLNAASKWNHSAHPFEWLNCCQGWPYGPAVWAGLHWLLWISKVASCLLLLQGLSAPGDRASPLWLTQTSPRPEECRNKPAPTFSGLTRTRQPSRLLALPWSTSRKEWRGRCQPSSASARTLLSPWAHPFPFTLRSQVL